MIPCIIRIFELEQISLTLLHLPVIPPYAYSGDLFSLIGVANLRYTMYSSASPGLCFEAVSLPELKEWTLLRTRHLVTGRKSAYA